MTESNKFPGSVKIGNEIYVYKNFLSKDILEQCKLEIESAPESSWIDGAQFNKATLRTLSANFMRKILKKIQDEVVPYGLFLEDTPSVNQIKLGLGMEEHSDDCPHCKKIKNPSMEISDHEAKRCVLYGIVVYLSEFTGGEIYYPNQEVIFAPEPGDMIIHATSVECKHGVKPVLSGNRFVVSPYIVKYNSQEDTEKAFEFWKNYSDFWENYNI